MDGDDELGEGDGELAGVVGGEGVGGGSVVGLGFGLELGEALLGVD